MFPLVTKKNNEIQFVNETVTVVIKLLSLLIVYVLLQDLGRIINA